MVSGHDNHKVCSLLLPNFFFGQFNYVEKLIQKNGKKRLNLAMHMPRICAYSTFLRCA